VAITFLSPEDTDVYYDLKQALSKSAISEVPEELRRHEVDSPNIPWICF
jgi:ATP-dependent RNA helicase DDX23/PRP28